MNTKIKGEVEGMEDSEDEGFNPGKVWRLKKKLSPKISDPPTAMHDFEGKLLTSDKGIKVEVMKNYQNVLMKELLKKT